MFICELLYVVATTVTKVAIAAYFLRLSSKRYQRVVIYSTLAAVMVFSTMYFFFLMFQCSPINFLWTKYTEDGRGTCLNSTTLSAVTYAHCAMSAITDWSFGILPIFFVWRMQMNPRTKFSVILILSLGFLYVLVSISLVTANTNQCKYSNNCSHSLHQVSNRNRRLLLGRNQPRQMVHGRTRDRNHCNEHRHASSSLQEFPLLRLETLRLIHRQRRNPAALK